MFNEIIILNCHSHDSNMDTFSDALSDTSSDISSQDWSLLETDSRDSDSYVSNEDWVFLQSEINKIADNVEKLCFVHLSETEYSDIIVCHIHRGDVDYEQCRKNPHCVFKCHTEDWRCPNIPQCKFPEIDLAAEIEKDNNEYTQGDSEHENISKDDHESNAKFCLIHNSEHDKWKNPYGWDCKFSNVAEEVASILVCHIHRGDANDEKCRKNPNCFFRCHTEDWGCPNIPQCKFPEIDSPTNIENINADRSNNFEEDNWKSLEDDLEEGKSTVNNVDVYDNWDNENWNWEFNYGTGFRKITKSTFIKTEIEKDDNEFTQFDSKHETISKDDHESNTKFCLIHNSEHDKWKNPYGWDCKFSTVAEEVATILVCHIHRGDANDEKCRKNPNCFFRCHIEDWGCPNIPQCKFREIDSPTNIENINADGSNNFEENNWKSLEDDLEEEKSAVNTVAVYDNWDNENWNWEFHYGTGFRKITKSAFTKTELEKDNNEFTRADSEHEAISKDDHESNTKFCLLHNCKHDKWNPYGWDCRFPNVPEKVATILLCHIHRGDADYELCRKNPDCVFKCYVEDWDCPNIPQCKFPEIDLAAEIEKDNNEYTQGDSEHENISKDDHESNAKICLRHNCEHDMWNPYSWDCKFSSVPEEVATILVCHIHRGDADYELCRKNPDCVFKCHAEDWDCPNIPQCKFPEIDLAAEIEKDNNEYTQGDSEHENFSKDDHESNAKICLIHNSEHDMWNPYSWDCKFSNVPEKVATILVCHIHRGDADYELCRKNPDCVFKCHAEVWDCPNIPQCKFPEIDLAAEIEKDNNEYTQGHSEHENISKDDHEFNAKICLLHNSEHDMWNPYSWDVQIS